MNNTRFLATIAGALIIIGFVGATVLTSVYSSKVRTDEYVHAHRVSTRLYSHPGPRYVYLTDQQETAWSVFLYLGIGGAGFLLALAAWVRWAVRE